MSPPTKISFCSCAARVFLACALSAVAAGAHADGHDIAAQRATDQDRDGLSDADEEELGSKPDDADSDDDGLLDGDEREPDADTDEDGLINVLDFDSDGDGLPDGLEVGNECNDPDTRRAVRACKPDSDAGESSTDPLDPDSDGDGFLDGEEDLNRNGVKDEGEDRDPTNGPKTGGDEFGASNLVLHGGGLAGCSAGAGEPTAGTGLWLIGGALGLILRRRRRA